LALVIGVFLVVLVTAGGGAVRDYAVTQLSQLGGPDVTVVAFGGELNADYVERVRSVDGVGAVAEVYLNIAETGGSISGFPVSAVDFRDAAGLGLTFEEGSPDSVGPNDLIIPSFFTSQGGLALGETVEVIFGTGETRQMRIGAIAQPGIPPAIYM